MAAEGEMVADNRSNDRPIVQSLRRISLARDRIRRRNTGLYHRDLAGFDSAVQAGGKPIPRPFVEPLALSMDVWEGTKQAGGLNLIDVPTFVRVSRFYNS